MSSPAPGAQNDPDNDDQKPKTTTDCSANDRCQRCTGGIIPFVDFVHFSGFRWSRDDLTEYVLKFWVRGPAGGGGSEVCVTALVTADDEDDEGGDEVGFIGSQRVIGGKPGER